ncbi:MAG: response regulator [Burkholderiaceae bacterium]|nr:response regulator [Burkholderiaceae bacterium]
MNCTFTPLRILIVENQALLFNMIRDLFSFPASVEVVGTEFGTQPVYEACLRIRPHLVLLDWGLKDLDGIDIIHQLRRRWESLRIVVVVASAEERCSNAALAAGALAYVSRQSPRQVLLAALQCATLGRTYIDTGLKLESPAIGTPKPRPIMLSPCERQVLKLAAEGRNNREIAVMLGKKFKAVETHRLSLMRMLNADSLGDLRNWSRRLGLSDC